MRNAYLDGPSAGEVRLYHDYYAPSYYYGHVEVYSGEEWGIVADDSSWTIEDGEVVCQQLGYDTPRKFLICYRDIIIGHFKGALLYSVYLLIKLVFSCVIEFNIIT